MRRALAGPIIAAITIVGAGCAGPSGGADDPTATAVDPVVVTFDVGAERFRALLDQPDDIAIARRLLAGEDAPSIPNGLVVRRTGVNDGWSWSLDPADISFADTTIEGCDGLPSDVEDGTTPGDRYCPWSATVVAIDPAP